jgi:plastocyanin
MIRRSLFVLAAIAIAALAVPLAPAAAGGGCHGDPTTGGGDTVEMLNACFTPTSLRVDPGATVTFVNRDPIAHNVGGADWGRYEDMVEGDAFSATFADPGVYPYACSYHPGMTGVIVVGTGLGAGNGDEVAVRSFLADQAVGAPAAGSETVAAAATPEPSGPGPVGWIAAGAAGLALGLGIGTLARRRPRGSSPEA